MFSSFRYSKLFFLSVLFFSSTIIYAQTETNESNEDIELFRVRLAEFGLEYMTPQNTFGERMNTQAIGVSGTLLYQTKPERPTFVGLDFYYGQFYRVSAPIGDILQTTRTSIYGLDFISRYYPFNNVPIIDPFIEGLVGAKMILSGTSVILIDTNENIDFAVESSKFSFSYGFSAGFQMNLYQKIYYLNFKGSYLRGSSNGFYALPDDLPNENLTINDLDFRNAPIDLLRWQIGISFGF